jgi:(p)ppGpp synthase/HD superfamily hydrolase
MLNLEDAISLAVDVHRSQKDEAGKPFVLHCIRVMTRLRNPNEIEQIAAILHDTVEDTNITIDNLRSMMGIGFPPESVDAIEILTRRKGQDYQKYIERVATNPIAIKVKLSDLQDNMDLTRLPAINEYHFKRLKKYEEARRFLLAQ